MNKCQVAQKSKYKIMEQTGDETVTASDAKMEQSKPKVAKSYKQLQAEKANRIAEQYLIAGDVTNAEKMLQQGHRLFPTERAIELLTEIVTGRDNERDAGRQYKGRRSAVDGAIRSMFAKSKTIHLNDEIVDQIVQACQGIEEYGAEMYAMLEHSPGATSKEVTTLIADMQKMWDLDLKKHQAKSSHGHSHNGQPCGGHGHSQGHVQGQNLIPMSANDAGINAPLVGIASMGGILGLLAAQFGSRMPFVAILAPLGSMSCVILTVLTAYYLWRTGENIRDPRVIFPAISELGAAMPEHRVYQVGFAMTGLLLFIHIRLFSQLVVPKLLEYGTPEMQNHADLAISWGYYSAAGVILQGVFTLEMQISMQSMIHWGGAVLFMSGAMNHAQNSKSLYESALESSDHISILRNESLLNAIHVRKLILDYSTFFMFVPIILAQLYFASSSSSTGTTPAARRLPDGTEAPPLPDPKTMNTMGVMQWAIVLQFAIYFCTYAVDLWVVVSDLQQKQKSQ